MQPQLITYTWLLPWGILQGTPFPHKLFWASMLIFKCISIFSGTGVCLKIRRPPQPNTSNVRAYFYGNFMVPTSPCICPLLVYLPVDDWTLPTQIYTDRYTYAGALTRSVPLQAIEHHPIFSFFSCVYTDPSIDPFIKSNPPIPSLSIEANQVNSPISIRLLSCIIHWIALIILTWTISIYIISKPFH